MKYEQLITMNAALVQASLVEAVEKYMTKWQARGLANRLYRERHLTTDDHGVITEAIRKAQQGSKRNK